MIDLADLKAKYAAALMGEANVPMILEFCRTFPEMAAELEAAWLESEQLSKVRYKLQCDYNRLLEQSLQDANRIVSLECDYGLAKAELEAAREVIEAAKHAARYCNCNELCECSMRMETILRIALAKLEGE